MSVYVLRIIGIAAVAAVLGPALAAAEPIKLKFSFFTSDRSNIYQTSIKPFVDAVNADGKGLIEIEMYFSGAISKVQIQQPQLVADGVADLAVIVPGQSPEQFYDNAVLELPGLYRDAREAALVFSRMARSGALAGYDKFFVIGAFVSQAETVHSRKPVASLDDLKGLKVRTNNIVEATVLKKLGAEPMLLAINRTSEAISRGEIDAATAPPSMLYEFGIGRVAANHFMIRIGGAPTALIMNRKKFESLPLEAQSIIRQYSGDWLSERAMSAMGQIDHDVLEQLAADPRRHVVDLTSAERLVVQKVFDATVAEWAATNAHNRELLDRARAEITRLRTSN